MFKADRHLLSEYDSASTKLRWIMKLLFIESVDKTKQVLLL